MAIDLSINNLTALHSEGSLSVIQESIELMFQSFKVFSISSTIATPINL